MTTIPLDAAHTEPTADLFGRRVAAVLDAGARDLPHDLSERLRAARVQAVARRKNDLGWPAAATVVSSRGQASLGATWWARLAAAVPLAALVGGLILINQLQDERRAAALADVDSALLTDDLPPAAYTDPGFTQFLRNGGRASD